MTCQENHASTVLSGTTLTGRRAMRRGNHTRHLGAARAESDALRVMATSGHQGAHSPRSSSALRSSREGEVFSTLASKNTVLIDGE